MGPNDAEEKRRCLLAIEEDLPGWGRGTSCMSRARASASKEQQRLMCTSPLRSSSSSSSDGQGTTLIVSTALSGEASTLGAPSARRLLSLSLDNEARFPRSLSLLSADEPSISLSLRRLASQLAVADASVLVVLWSAGREPSLPFASDAIRALANTRAPARADCSWGRVIVTEWDERPSRPSVAYSTAVSPFGQSPLRQ